MHAAFAAGYDRRPSSAAAAAAAAAASAAAADPYTRLQGIESTHEAIASTQINDPVRRERIDESAEETYVQYFF